MAAEDIPRVRAARDRVVAHLDEARDRPRCEPPARCDDTEPADRERKKNETKTRRLVAERPETHEVGRLAPSSLAERRRSRARLARCVAWPKRIVKR